MTTRNSCSRPGVCCLPRVIIVRVYKLNQVWSIWMTNHHRTDLSHLTGLVRSMLKAQFYWWWTFSIVSTSRITSAATCCTKVVTIVCATRVESIFSLVVANNKKIGEKKRERRESGFDLIWPTTMVPHSFAAFKYTEREKKESNKRGTAQNNCINMMADSMSLLLLCIIYIILYIYVCVLFKGSGGRLAVIYIYIF